MSVQELQSDIKEVLESVFLFAIASTLRAPLMRSMERFAEEEIRLSTGPYKGTLFSVERQPYAAAWFALVHCGRWNRYFMTGCVQSGKTLCGFVIPILYHLFEQRESVACLCPDGVMVGKKWREDILPAISNSRYREFLPTQGAGSKGGDITIIYFTNGTFLQFMTGGGSDKSRAGATVRILVVTEVDGMDEASEKSREADPITQSEVRTDSFGDRKRIYGECTVSIEKGRTWQEYTKGTSTRLLVACCKCQELVTPEREDLYEWQEAENEIDAKSRAFFACPSCGAKWTEDDRQLMLRDVKVIHRGQRIINRKIVGEYPKTMTLGFRWNAFFNRFWSTAYIATNEWIASRSEDTEAAEKARLQFAWAKPFKPDMEASIPVDRKIIMARSNAIPEKVVPSNTLYLAIGLDLGAYLAHWILVAHLDNGTLHEVQYGAIKVNSLNLGVEHALKACLHEFKDMVNAGWATPDGTPRIPDRALIDSGYQGEKGSRVVYDFISEHGGGRFYAADGRGDATDGAKQYSHPAQVSTKVFVISEQYYIGLTEQSVMLVAINSNYWKSWVHKRLTTPIGLPGALSLHQGEGNTHEKLAKHLTSERSEFSPRPGKGNVEIWVKKPGANHWFDALYYACVGLHMAGARIIEKRTPLIEAKPAPVIEPEAPFVRPVVNSDSSGGWIRRRNAAT